MAFTRKEEKFLHDPYFRVIRETDTFTELESVNTGHCWNVFKNTIERGMKVVLYHKHKVQDPYYHEHRICRTVSEAIEQIKAHDEYILSRESAIVASDKKEDRKLKVYETSGYKYKTTSQIRLTCEFDAGIWSSLVQEVIVKAKDDIVFKFKNGFEVRV